MANEKGSGRAICPYYRGEGKQFITCQGLVSRSSIRMFFSQRGRREYWQDTRCNQFSYATRCPVAETQERMFARLEAKRQKRRDARHGR